MNGVLIATDLDRTLIYSVAAAGVPDPDGPPWVVVEWLDGRALSHMTAVSAARYADLSARCCVVPVTTRTPAQLARVQLPGPPPRYAVAANGGVLLEAGKVDLAWADAVRSALREVADLESACDRLTLACAADPHARIHTVPELFCYAVLDRSLVDLDALAELRGWGRSAGWGVSLQGRKLYLVPVTLTKSAAVAEVARRTGVHTVLAAGDSLLDTDLLEFADRAIRPGHGELADSGWSAPTVVGLPTVGIRAGEEILGWLADAAAEVD